MPELMNKVHDEQRQGEAIAPAEGDQHIYLKKFYIESYGCQMNFSDSEIIASILQGEGFGATRNVEDADLIFLNTCSIREKAQEKVFHQLGRWKHLKQKKLKLNLKKRINSLYFFYLIPFWDLKFNFLKCTNKSVDHKFKSFAIN